MRRGGLLAVAVVAASMVSAADRVEPGRQIVEVAVTGRAEVDLEGSLGAAIAAGERLRLLAPGGLAVPFELIPRRTMPPRTARLTAVSELADGWELRLDLGEERPLHDRLDVRFSELVLVPRCRLEGSPDARRWQPLAEGDLFRLGRDRDLAQTVLTYAPTRVRYLRLLWPREAGFPHLEEATVRAAEADELSAPVASLACSSQGATGRICRAEVPRWADQVVLAMATPDDSVGFRILEARSGSWRVTGDGIARRGVESDPRVTLPLDRPETAELERILRIELNGMSGRPRVANLDIRMPALSLHFEAREIGDYELSVADPREAAPLPHSQAVGRPVERRRFTRSWIVEAPGATPGALVELDVPPDAYAAAPGRLEAQIRLAAEDREVPFVLLRGAEPAALGRFPALEPREGTSPGVSSVALAAAGVGARWTELHLRTGSRIFERELRLFGRDDPARGQPAAERVVASTRWACSGLEPLPCWTRLPLAPTTRLEELRLDIVDGDNPPLDRVEAEIWGTSHRLRLLWPAAGGVELLAGAADLAAPRYDLEILRDLLLALPALPARVTSGESPEIGGTLQRLGRPLVIAALILVAGVLLLLLIRLIR